MEPRHVESSAYSFGWSLDEWLEAQPPATSTRWNSAGNSAKSEPAGKSRRAGAVSPRSVSRFTYSIRPRPSSSSSSLATPTRLLPRDRRHIPRSSTRSNPAKTLPITASLWRTVSSRIPGPRRSHMRQLGHPALGTPGGKRPTEILSPVSRCCLQRNQSSKRGAGSAVFPQCRAGKGRVTIEVSGGRCNPEDGARERKGGQNGKAPPTS